MAEDRELWSEWALSLREQGLGEPALWLIKAVKPLSLLLSQVMTMTLPFFSNHKSYDTLFLMAEMLEDKDRLEAFTQALQAIEGGG